MSIFDFWRKKAESPAPPPTPPASKRKSPMISPELLSLVGGKPDAKPFTIPKPPPGVVPKGGLTMAMDRDLGAINTWAARLGGLSGMEWIGFTILAELAQRPEYRRISRVKANEMTRRWIKLEAVGGEDKSDRIKDLTAALKRFRVRDAFRRCAELDGLFGRAHLYLDTGYTDDPDELRTKLTIRPEKIGKGSLKRLQVVEPIWTYPTAYNSSEPLRADFYKPQAWYVMGQEIHASRFLTFIGREMPDILKPAYLLHN